MRVKIDSTFYQMTQESAEALFTSSWPGQLMRAPFVWLNSASGPQVEDMVEVPVELIITLDSGTELDLYALVYATYVDLGSSATVTVTDDDGVTLITRPLIARTSFTYRVIRQDSLQALVASTLLVGPVTVNF